MAKVNIGTEGSMIYGYCRVSTAHQNIERQRRNIKAAYPAALLKEDKFTGTEISRPTFDKILKAVKPGDTIVFDSVSRMSRNADDGIELYEKLFNDGVNLVFLKEPQINTDTYKESAKKQIGLISTGDEATDELLKAVSDGINRYMLALAKKQIRLAFEQAEKEVLDLRQRIKEGIETRRLNNEPIGGAARAEKGCSTFTTKKSEAAKELIAHFSKDFAGDLSDTELIEKLESLNCKVSRNSFYKYKREMKAEELCA